MKQTHDMTTVEMNLCQPLHGRIEFCLASEPDRVVFSGRFTGWQLAFTRGIEPLNIAHGDYMLWRAFDDAGQRMSIPMVRVKMRSVKRESLSCKMEAWDYFPTEEAPADSRTDAERRYDEARRTGSVL